VLSAIASLDVKIFRVVNAIDLPAWASAVLSVLARSNLWIAPIALGFVLLAVLGGRRERSYVVVALITLALTEFIVSGLMKPLFGRLRPCHVLEGVRLLGGCTSSFAMASGHAGNSFAQAVAVGLFYRPAFLISLPIASLVSLSRVIDGKHYPSDVVVGALVGIAVAIVVVRLLRTRLETADRLLFRPHALVEKFAPSETRESSQPALVFWSVLALATVFRIWYVGWADLMPEEAVVWDRARFMSGLPSWLHC
jgi:undecaprenyl-diphosphatase